MTVTHVAVAVTAEDFFGTARSSRDQRLAAQGTQTPGPTGCHRVGSEFCLTVVDGAGGAGTEDGVLLLCVLSGPEDAASAAPRLRPPAAGRVRACSRPPWGSPAAFPAFIFRLALLRTVSGEHGLGVFRLRLGMTHGGCRPSGGLAGPLIF